MSVPATDRSQWLQPRAIHVRLQGTTVSHSTMNIRAPSPVSQRSSTGSQTRTCCSITSTVIISWACLTEGVGALVRFRRKGETLTKKPGTTREPTRSDRAPQRTRTGQPERPTGKARRRRPDRADPTSLPWELERDARGRRQETTLPFRSECRPFFARFQGRRQRAVH